MKEPTVTTADLPESIVIAMKRRLGSAYFWTLPPEGLNDALEELSAILRRAPDLRGTHA